MPKTGKVVTFMFAGAWCGQMGVGGWVLMGLFWAAFLGLVVWALSQLFAPARVADDLHGDSDELDLRLARGQVDLAEYRLLHEQLTSSGHH